MQRSIRRGADHVGERAAAIHGERPTDRFALCSVRQSRPTPVRQQPALDQGSRQARPGLQIYRQISHRARGMMWPIMPKPARPARPAPAARVPADVAESGAPKRSDHRGRAQDTSRPGDDVRRRRGSRRTPAPGPTRWQGAVGSATGQRGAVAAGRCGRRAHCLSGRVPCARTADIPPARRRHRCSARTRGPGPARLGRGLGRPGPAAVVGRMRPRPRYAVRESLIMPGMRTGALPG